MEYISIILAAILVNNIVLTQISGVNPIIAVSHNIESSIIMGLAITFVITLSSIFTKIVNDYILVEYGLEFLKIFIYIFVIEIIIHLSYKIIKSISKEDFDVFESFIPVVSTNSLILTVALMVVDNNFGLVETIIYSIGIGLGFTLLSLIISEINYKYRYANVPRSILEKPITFIALGLVALAFYGFNGLV